MIPMQKKWEPKYIQLTSNNNFILLLMDFICIALGLVLIPLLLKCNPRSGVDLFAFPYALLPIIYLISCMFFLWSFDIFSYDSFETKQVVITQILSGVYAFCSTLLIYRIFWGSIINLLYFCLSWAISVGSMIGGHNLLRHFYKFSIKRPIMLILGAEEENDTHICQIKCASSKRFAVEYKRIAVEDTDNDEIIYKNLTELFSTFDVICLAAGMEMKIRDMAIKACIDVNKELYFEPELNGISYTKGYMAFFGDALIFHIKPAGIGNVNFFVKSKLDLLLSLIALVIMGIPMLSIAIWIKITSKGPVFSKQVCFTENKRKFQVYKFRTCVHDTSIPIGSRSPLNENVELTEIGKFLSETHMDKLPQLVNILRGEMSFIGPKPEPATLAKQCEKKVQIYDERFLIRPGMISLSRVKKECLANIADEVDRDLFYIRNYSLLLDFKILLHTSRAVLSNEIKSHRFLTSL